MTKLDNNLKEWVSKGIISQPQANKISEHEATKAEKSWILTGFLILGVVTLGLGIISLIAANWQDIPDALKLAADFILLLLLGLRIFTISNKQHHLQFEILLMAYLILCLASIGLISQIYQVSGTLDQALLFWALITFGVAYAGKQMFVPMIWLIGFLIGISYSFLNSRIFEPIFQENIYAVLLFIPLFCLCLMQLTQRIKNHTEISRALVTLSLFSSIIALIIVEIHVFSSYKTSDFLVPYTPAYILAAISIIFILFKDKYNLLQKSLLWLSIIALLAIYLLPVFAIKSDLSYATLSMLLLASVATFMASIKKRGLFQGFLLLLGLRILILYFQAIGGLAMTGMGLIVSGLVIIGMAVLWNKYRIILAIKIERWTHAAK